MKSILKTIALTILFSGLLACVAENDIEFVVKKDKSVDINVTTSYEKSYISNIKPSPVSSFNITSEVDLTAIYDAASDIRDLELTGFSLTNPTNGGHQGYYKTTYLFADNYNYGYFSDEVIDSDFYFNPLLFTELDCRIMEGSVKVTLIKGADDFESGTESNDIQIYSGPLEMPTRDVPTNITLPTPIAGTQFLDDSTKKFKLRIQYSNGKLYDDSFTLQMTLKTQAVAGGK